MSDPVEVGTAFILGTLLGSFLNVVVYRLPLGIDIFARRSFCPHCKVAVPGYLKIPVLSYLWLRGQCNSCTQHISVRYPIVELVAGIALGYIYARWGLTPSALSSILLACGMMVLALIDIDHRTLPNVITLPGAALGVALSFIDPRVAWWESILGVLLGGGSLYAVAVLYRFMRSREGMGMGDIKMMMMVGAFLGWRGAFLTIFLGSLLGTIVGVVFIIGSRRGWEYALPFGTFLAVAAMVSASYGPQILNWYWQLGIPAGP